MKAKVLTGTIKPEQIVDYYLLEEIANGWPYGFTTRVYGKVSQHNYRISKSKICARATKIRSGQDYLQPASDFASEPSPREGKDRCYEGLWTLIDVLMPDKDQRSYIGLAANQIDRIRNKIDSINPIVVVEGNRNKAANLKRLAKSLSLTPGPKVIVKNSNIFCTLKSKISKENYNIFDLDLMTFMPSEVEINKWAQAIWNAAKPGINIVYLAVCVGRAITEDEHYIKTRYLHKALDVVGFREIGSSPFSYRDRIIPMRGERIVIKKEKRGKNEQAK